jgi:hypothetical protein
MDLYNRDGNKYGARNKKNVSCFLDQRRRFLIGFVF